MTRADLESTCLLPWLKELHIPFILDATSRPPSQRRRVYVR
jgi:hypothetical protein